MTPSNAVQSVNQKSLRVFRRAALLAVALCLFSNASYAQLRFGLLGGANFGSLKDATAGSSVVNFDNKTGYHLGAFLDIGFGSVGLRPSAYYLNAGPLFEGADFLENDNFDVGYLVVPVDLRFSMGPGPLTPFVLVGPEFRILANANDAPSDLKDELKNLVMDAGVGLGLELNLGGLTIFPQVKYTFGLSEVVSKDFEIGGVSVTTDENQRHNSWLLSAGIVF